MPAKWWLGALGAAVPPLSRAHGADADLIDRLGAFGAGLSHPVLGADHFLAMFAVGLLSAVLGGTYLWRLPVVFVLAMPVGWSWGRQALPFSPVEIGIAASVLALGIAGAASTRWLPVLRNRLVYLPAATFAEFHGYAHGVQMPPEQPALQYAAGFMTGTAAIHLLGLLAGNLIAGAKHRARLLSLTSLAPAAAGCWFLALAYGCSLTQAG